MSDINFFSPEGGIFKALGERSETQGNARRPWPLLALIIVSQPCRGDIHVAFEIRYGNEKYEGVRLTLGFAALTQGFKNVTLTG